MSDIMGFIILGAMLIFFLFGWPWIYVLGNYVSFYVNKLPKFRNPIRRYWEWVYSIEQRVKERRNP